MELMIVRCLLLLSCLLAAIPAHADPDADRAAITTRLQQWTTAFNAHDAAGIRDLFAPDLVAIVPGSIDGTRDQLCANLDALLARPDLQLHYDNPEIREITISGDIAVVRPIWTLTTRKGGERDVTTEAGIDIFQRQPDGRWSISRFASFTDKPNKNLQ
jgi:steroid delta-isomerase